jgi:Trk K+ transport system NAD-binding subunit
MRAVDESGQRQGEERHQGGHLLWLADAAERDGSLGQFVGSLLGDALVAGEGLLQRVPPVGVHRAGVDGVDAHPVPAVLLGDRRGEVDVRGVADLVLAVADGTPRDPLTRRRDPVREVTSLLRRLVWHRFGLVFAALLAVILLGFLLLAVVPYSFNDTVYLTLMDLSGSALTSTRASGAEKIAQVLLTFNGLAFIPVVTAIIVGARLTGSVRGAPRPAGGHVIVVGLGNVGTSVTGQLHDLGFDVACIDNNPDALGIPLARQLGLPLVIGDAFRDETLRAAGLDTCIALVSVTSQDIVNLETALNARALRDDVRIVLRLTDDDLAERLQKTISNTVSRSVPYLAAPAFATAMLEHQVLRTIAVGRHVLLIADVRVGDQVGLAGSSVRDTEHDGQARVLALQPRGSAGLDWSPARGHLLAAGDQLIVLATRKGLEPFLSVREPDS